jgi:hypothetical protein
MELAFSYQRVVPGGESCEAVASILLRNGPRLCARPSVAQNDGGAIKRRRMQVSQFTAEGAQLSIGDAN